MDQSEAAPAKPLPPMEGLAGQFYEWCRRGELRLQRCSVCKAWRHPPREMCPECGSWDWDWTKSSGQGRVFSWTVATRALHPAFKGDVPYAAVIIQMEEGVRLISRVMDCLPDELTVDMPVEVSFEQVTDDVVLPYFRLRRLPDA